MRSYFSALFIIMAIFLNASLAYAATEITGTVTAKRGDSVQVTFEAHETAGPKLGDAVSFSKEIPGTGGIKAKAGEGTVVEVEGTTVWVKTTDNRPNLKMDAVIKATGDPAPKEYSFELSGSEFKARGVVYWHPNGIFRFQYSTPLIVKKNDVLYVIEFPEGAYLVRPDPRPAFEKTHKTHHLEGLKKKIELEELNKKLELSVRGSDDWQVVNDIVWSGREVKGRNTVFLVSQLIHTKRSLKDRKVLREEKKQEFLISFELPTPPLDSRTFTKHYWHITLQIPDFLDKQYRPEYWEKICLEVLQSASVDLRGGTLENPFKKKSYWE